MCEWGGRLTAALVGARDGALGLTVAVVGVVREAVPDEVPDQRTDARVEQVLQQDVLDVLGTDAPRAEDGEATLHEEDERTGPHQVEGVELAVVRCHLYTQVGREVAWDVTPREGDAAQTDKEALERGGRDTALRAVDMRGLWRVRLRLERREAAGERIDCVVHGGHRCRVRRKVDASKAADEISAISQPSGGAVFAIKYHRGGVGSVCIPTKNNFQHCRCCEGHRSFGADSWGTHEILRLIARTGVQLQVAHG